MKIRIKDPQQGNSKSLFLWAFILAGVVLFLACGVKDEIFLLKLFSVLIPLILLLLVGAFYNLYKARKQRRAPNYVPALDFQPTGVVLSIGGQERVLLYEETPLRLLIHIQQKQHENNRETFVGQITFIFQSDDTQLCVEHETNFEDLFPLLQQARRFVHFSYDFELKNTRGMEAELYKKFVAEQLENQLHYGLHLPFPPYQLFGNWCGIAFFTIVLLLIICSKDETDGIVGTLLLGLFLTIGLLGFGREILRFYRAKHKLDKFQK